MRSRTRCPISSATTSAADPPLIEGLEREGAGWAREDLHAVGRLAGSAVAAEWADAAHRNEPRLRTHDRVGHRVDEVDYDPAYQELTRVAVEHGFAGAPWADDAPGGPRRPGGRAS